MSPESSAFLDELRRELRSAEGLDAEVVEIVIARLVDGSDPESDAKSALLALETIALRRASTLQ